MCTGGLLLTCEEHLPPGAASGGQQRPQYAAASTSMQPPGRGHSAAMATDFFNGCRCGARQTARVGAIRTCALRCASACGGCEVAPPLWPTVCKSDVFVSCSRCVTFCVMWRACVLRCVRGPVHERDRLREKMHLKLFKRPLSVDKYIHRDMLPVHFAQKLRVWRQSYAAAAGVGRLVLAVVGRV